MVPLCIFSSFQSTRTRRPTNDAPGKPRDGASDVARTGRQVSLNPHPSTNDAPSATERGGRCQGKVRQVSRLQDKGREMRNEGQVLEVRVRP